MASAGLERPGQTRLEPGRSSEGWGWGPDSYPLSTGVGDPLSARVRDGARELARENVPEGDGSTLV